MVHKPAPMKEARTDTSRHQALQGTTTAAQFQLLQVSRPQVRQGSVGVDTRRLRLGLDMLLPDLDTRLPDPDTILLDPDTILLDPDMLLVTPVLLVLHQVASMVGLLHSLQPLMVHHTSMEITLLMVHHISTEITLLMVNNTSTEVALLSFQEHLEDMVTAAAGGRGSPAYFENVGCTKPSSVWRL